MKKEKTKTIQTKGKGFSKFSNLLFWITIVLECLSWFFRIRITPSTFPQMRRLVPQNYTNFRHLMDNLARKVWISTLQIERNGCRNIVNLFMIPDPTWVNQKNKIMSVPKKYFCKREINLQILIDFGPSFKNCDLWHE